MLEIRGNVFVDERAEAVVFKLTAPGLALAFRSVALQILKDLAHIELLLRREPHRGSSSQ